MSFVHAALVNALDLPMHHIVPEEIGEEIRNKIEQARKSLATTAE